MCLYACVSVFRLRVCLLVGGGKLKTVFYSVWFLLYFAVVVIVGYLCALNGGYCFVLVEVLKLIWNERKDFFSLRNESFPRFCFNVLVLRLVGCQIDDAQYLMMVCHMSLIALRVCLLWSLFSLVRLCFRFYIFLPEGDVLIVWFGNSFVCFRLLPLTWFLFWTSKFTYLHMCVLWFCFWWFVSISSTCI